MTGGLILFAAIRFRRKDGDPAPKQMRYNVPLEVMYTIVPLVMILGMFFFTARDQTELTKVSANPDNTVGVVGFRWSWAFNYVEDDVYDVGTAEVEDMPTLYLPVNESVVFELQSPDVIHSFWIPAFLMKMDVFPDRLNKFEVTPNKVGTYRRPLRRAVRRGSRADAVHREGRGARRVRPAHGRAAGPRARPARSRPIASPARVSATGSPTATESRRARCDSSQRPSRRGRRRTRTA